MKEGDKLCIKWTSYEGGDLTMKKVEQVHRTVLGTRKKYSL